MPRWVFDVFKDWRGQGLFNDGECGDEEAVSKQEGKNNIVHDSKTALIIDKPALIHMFLSIFLFR